MQIFLIGALAVALIAVLFAIQNTGAVTVVFLGWTFQGSLALVLFVAFVGGAFASLLAAVPSMVKGRWATGQRRKELAALQARLADCEQNLQAAEHRLHLSPPQAPADGPFTEIEKPPEV